MGITTKRSNVQKKEPSKSIEKHSTGFNKISDVIELQDYDKEKLMERVKVKLRLGWEQVGEIRIEVGGKNPPIITKKKRLDDKRDRRYVDKASVFKVTLRKKDISKTKFAHQ